MTPWKTSRGHQDGPRGSELQWGHGDDAVEDADAVNHAVAEHNALQWGHGDDAVEDTVPRIVLAVS